MLESSPVNVYTLDLELLYYWLTYMFMNTISVNNIDSKIFNNRRDQTNWTVAVTDIDNYTIHSYIHYYIHLCYWQGIDHPSYELVQWTSLAVTLGLFCVEISDSFSTADSHRLTHAHIDKSYAVATYITADW